MDLRPTHLYHLLLSKTSYYGRDFIQQSILSKKVQIVVRFRPELTPDLKPDLTPQLTLINIH